MTNDDTDPNYNPESKLYNSVQIKLNRTGIQERMPSADFTTNGYTVIIHLEKPMVAAFHVSNSKKEFGYRASEGIPDGDKLSFVPDFKFRLGKDEIGTFTIHFQSTKLSMSNGGSLPNNQKITKIQILEGEFAYVEPAFDHTWGTQKQLLTFVDVSGNNLSDGSQARFHDQYYLISNFYRQYMCQFGSDYYYYYGSFEVNYFNYDILYPNNGFFVT